MMHLQSVVHRMPFQPHAIIFWLPCRAGQPYWEAAGVADQIDLRIAPATETLNALLEVDALL